MDVKKKTLGRRLKKARLEKGLTQVAVAKKLKLNRCSHKNISRWESGEHAPNLRGFVKLCRIYGVTPNELLGF